MFAAPVLTYFLTWLLFERSRFGLKSRPYGSRTGGRSDGHSTPRWSSLQTFVLSAVVASVFGSIFAYWVTFINPKSVFGGDITDQMVVMVLLGGLGSLWGPAIGGVALFFVNRLVWMYYGDTAFYIAILGAAIILVVLFLPNGIAGLFARRSGKSGSVLDTVLGRLLGSRQGGRS